MEDLQKYFAITDSQMEKFKKFPDRLIKKALRNCQESERKSFKQWSFDHRRKHFRGAISYYLNGK